MEILKYKMSTEFWVEIPRSSDRTPAKGEIARVGMGEADSKGSKIECTACEDVVPEVFFNMQVVGIELQQLFTVELIEIGHPKGKCS